MMPCQNSIHIKLPFYCSITSFFSALLLLNLHTGLEPSASLLGKDELLLSTNICRANGWPGIQSGEKKIERKFKTKAKEHHVAKNPWRSPGSNLRHQIA